MKRLILTALLLPWAVAALACTNLIVGKKASTDGSVMCTYNCDGFGFAGSLPFGLPGRHQPGEQIALGGGRFIPQAEYTYGYAGLTNEQQVSIVETTWGGRKELENPEGFFNYFRLMQITLQRSATAREAIAVMHDLVQEYGYNSTGESFAVCDKDEAWIMEMIGKGPGRKGAVWVAPTRSAVSALSETLACTLRTSSPLPGKWASTRVTMRISASAKPTGRWTSTPSVTAKRAYGVSSATTPTRPGWTPTSPS